MTLGSLVGIRRVSSFRTRLERVRLTAMFIKPARLRAVLPQKPLRFPRVQTWRDIEEVHKADRAGGQKSSFTENLDAPLS